MKLEELKSKIGETGYLNNVKIGMVLASKYPLIYSDILKTTSSLDKSLYVNKYLRARVIFIFKYNLDENKIKNNKGWFTFDRKKDDFVDKTGDYVKQGWEKSKEHIKNDVYSLKETINLLKNNNYYERFIGKSKNRTLIKENIKLFYSIYHHTKFMDLFNKNSNKFSMRILFLVKKNGDINQIKCDNCKINFTSFNYSINDYNKNCKSCFFDKVPHYPTINYFKIKFGTDWEKYYLEDRKKISNFKVNSKKWFINKFGDELGVTNYNEYLSKRIKILEDIKTKKYSKISQKLFWLIYNKLNYEEKEKCWFKELNKEILIKVSDNKFYFPDFIMNNKIIEYDGKYWHNDENDNVRNLLYEKNGFDVLIINEDNFNRKDMKNNTIENCVKFLRNEI